MREQINWSAVRTLDAYGAGLAAWLENQAPPPPALMTYSLNTPYHFGDPWPALVAANRKGLLVVTEVWQACTPWRSRPSGCSQPYQRAAFSGFVVPGRVEVLRRAFTSLRGGGSAHRYRWPPAEAGQVSGLGRQPQARAVASGYCVEPQGYPEGLWRQAGHAS